MNTRPLSRWLAGAIAAMLVLSVISTLGAAQAAPTIITGSPARQQAAQPSKPDKPNIHYSANHTAQPSVSGVTYNVYPYITGPISGTTDIGNHCDDCTTLITFPFPITLYGSPRTIAYASSNGNLQFASNNPAFTNTCLPNVGFSDTIYLYWDDLITDVTYPGAGIYTATLGGAPNRQYVIEWRAYQAQSELFTDEEIVFSENSSSFLTVYGNNPDNGSSATAGVQEGDGSGSFSHTQLSCDSAGLHPANAFQYIASGGPSPTPIPTATLAATATPDPCAVGWSQQAAYPSSVVAPAMAAQGGSLYSFGGLNNVALSTAYKYDGSSWIPLAPLPESRYNASAVSDGANLYILNGAPGPQYSNTLYRYNVAANTYTLLANPLVATEYQAAVYLDGKIYRIGGANASGILSSVEVYDIASNAWMTDTSYPMAIYSPAAIAMNGYIYVMGGQDGSSNLLTKTYRFNPATHSWDDGSIADLPQTRASSAVGIVNGQIVLAGGNVVGGTASDSAITWDPASNWMSLPNMIAPRFAAGGATINDALYVVGGYGAANVAHNDNQRYSLTVCSTPPPTPAPSNTPAPTNTPGGPTPTDCPNLFVDISGNVFYGAIHYLYCRGVVNGTSGTTYNPHGTSTRGQFAKVVVLGFGIASYTPTTPSFSDVPATYFAYLYIEAGYHAAILGGFSLAQCQAAGLLYPCYQPNLPITRGQLTKLVVAAAHYPLLTPASGQSFTDVSPSNVFFVSIETAHGKGVINGYPDNSFRPNNAIQRDQMCQIVFKGVTTP